MSRPRPPRGIVLYAGPSAIDGQPIVVIANGFRVRSNNQKTGDMIQTWILRSDINPLKAINTGADSSICGSCPLRGIIDASQDKTVNRMRSCYVRTEQAPLAVWKAYHNGSYETYGPRRHRRWFKRRSIRLGAYGDPAAAPYAVWKSVLRHAKMHTGYTHQWNDRRFWRFRRIVMASCQTVEESVRARSYGWRTFRVYMRGGPLAGEFPCPASEEQGYRLTCAECGACDGSGANAQRASVAIQLHGAPSIRGSYKKVMAAT